jgi:hypothetical protein
MPRTKSGVLYDGGPHSGDMPERWPGHGFRAWFPSQASMLATVAHARSRV